MSQKHPINIGVGSTSLITIFVVLCLIAFAVLSLLSAKNDLTLAKATAASTAAYYTAESAAEEQTAQIAEELHSGKTIETDKEGRITFDTPINDIKTLRYTVTVNGSEVKISQCRTIVQGD